MRVDRDKREIELKVVYYRVGLAGKTTNMQYVYVRTHPDRARTMVPLSDEYQRTLAFSFAPEKLAVNGFTLRFRLYTTPSSLFRDPARRAALANVMASLTEVAAVRSPIQQARPAEREPADRA